MDAPVVSVVVPTRGRVDYLAVTLDALEAQDLDAPYEVIVIDDGSRDETPALLAERRARSVRLEPPAGLNAARNRGLAAARAPLVAYTDDDVEAPRGWLRALVEGAARNPRAEAFGGPIRARFEGPVPRSCGRDAPLITTLDLGRSDRPTDIVWGANMLVRRSATERVGPFDETIGGGGDEEEWVERLRAHGGRVMYLAAAGVDHRRAGGDARLRSFVRLAYRRGRALRAFDRSRGRAPALARELRVLAGCCWHTVRRACPQGLVMGAHSLGRVVEAVRRR